jgi:hypothetical protein
MTLTRDSDRVILRALSHSPTSERPFARRNVVRNTAEVLGGTHGYIKMSGEVSD